VKPERGKDFRRYGGPIAADIDPRGSAGATRKSIKLLGGDLPPRRIRGKEPSQSLHRDHSSIRCSTGDPSRAGKARKIPERTGDSGNSENGSAGPTGRST